MKVEIFRHIGPVVYDPTRRFIVAPDMESMAFEIQCREIGDGANEGLEPSTDEIKRELAESGEYHGMHWTYVLREEPVFKGEISQLSEQIRDLDSDVGQLRDKLLQLGQTSDEINALLGKK